MLKIAKLCLAGALALCMATPVMADSATATTSGSTTTAADAAPSTTNSKTGATVTAKTVVATVNGQKITLGEMIALRDQLPPQYKQLDDAVLFKGILDQIIQQTMLEQSVAGKLSTRQQLQLANTKRAFVANLVLEGVTADATSEKALQAAYDKKFANFQPGLEYHAAHILVPTEKEAKDIKAQLDKGADFATLAKKDSKDGSAQNGGDLGWFGAGMMVKPFEDAVMKLKPGQISDPVQTQFGWHIIKLIATRPAKKPTLDDVRNDLAKQLQSEAVAAKIKTLTDGAKIEKTDSGIDPKLLSDESLISN
ncbi:peptidylprolyl isomerase [Solirhodobacter olei]|uniref:peptidylprolyl isomerase n=1 Tax=Solirhodobacter olei TaxID=2493082 RepID=UPI001F4E0B2C|nr:peptidylprolyl isomerase [Solirhodobacter olei]